MKKPEAIRKQTSAGFELPNLLTYHIFNRIFSHLPVTMDGCTAVLPRASSILESIPLLRDRYAHVILNLLCVNVFVTCGALWNMELGAGILLTKYSRKSWLHKETVLTQVRESKQHRVLLSFLLTS